MRHLTRIATFGAAALALAGWIVPTATAETVAREGISVGFQTQQATLVVRGRASNLQTAGNSNVLELTKLEDLKGMAPTTVHILVRKSWQDVKDGDEFVAFLRPVDAEKMGLGTGQYYTTLVPTPFGMMRVTDANRAAWVERVRTHATGSPADIIHRCAADVANPDTKLAGDALVDLWHQRAQDLATVLSSQEKTALTEAFLGDAGWKRLERERVHGIIVLGRAKAVEAYDRLLQRLDQDLHPDLAWSIGETFGQIDRQRAIQDLTARLTGTPEKPTPPATQLRLLGVLRGMGAAETLPAVQALFTSTDDQVRRWAIVTSGYVGAEPALAALVERLESGTGLDSWCAAFALHRSGGQQGWAEVKRIAQNHGDAKTRAWLQRFVRNPAMRGQDVLVKLTRGF